MQEPKEVDIVVAILMVTGQAAGPGAVPGPACCIDFGPFYANFVTYSLLIAYSISMCSFCTNGSF